MTDQNKIDLLTATLQAMRELLQSWANRTETAVSCAECQNADAEIGAVLKGIEEAK